MEEGVVIALQLAIPVFLLVMGVVVGTAREKAHLGQLKRREEATAGMLVTDIKTFPGGAEVSHGATMVIGQAVIATDYFKSFLAGFRKILGGELKSYLSLLDRARREAVLRMLEQAREGGFDAVCNVRLDTADIGGAMSPKGVVMVALVASGTAYKRSPGASPQA
jgi:uncharacterized protein YbjQ (UPF0145 family)